jgi:hypothetical protein
MEEYYEKLIQAIELLGEMEMELKEAILMIADCCYKNVPVEYVEEQDADIMFYQDKGDQNLDQLVELVGLIHSYREKILYLNEVVI